MERPFLKKENISRTFEDIDLDENYLEIKYFKGCKEICIDSDYYKYMRHKEDYEKLGDKVEEIYLRNGLCDEEANERLVHFGKNKLPERKKIPEIVKFLKEITNTFALLMWGAFALALLGYGLSPYEMENVSYNKFLFN